MVLKSQYDDMDCGEYVGFTQPTLTLTSANICFHEMRSSYNVKIKFLGNKILGKEITSM
jgi:hypothetical protein